MIRPEKELVGDTTHYHAYSSFETVRYEDDKGNEQKKSQSKLTKPCRCEDWQACPHEWELRDEGAGTIVKSGKKMIWGHKASIIGLPEQGIAIDAVAVSDAATHDGQTFFPHVEKVLGDHPDLAQSVRRVLYDSACDDAPLKQRFQDELGIELKASFNPRRSKAITEELPRGIEKITPYGVPICLAGHELDYQGIRYASEKFIYRAPHGDDGLSVCMGCRERAQCCNRSSHIGPNHHRLVRYPETYRPERSPHGQAIQGHYDASSLCGTYDQTPEVRPRRRSTEQTWKRFVPGLPG